MKKPDLLRLAPPGLELKHERRFFISGWIFSLLYAQTFLIDYFNYRSQLYDHTVSGRVLDPGRTMVDFYVVLDKCLIMFVVFALCMLLLIAYHYAYHHIGSKSIYTMRRLPDRWELHKRCVSLPIIASLVMLASAGIMLLIWFGLYMLLTPEQCLAPGQWTKLWEAI